MTALEAAKRFENPTDDYQRNLRDSARKMIYRDRWFWTYQTQYMSGATLWRNGDKSVLVPAEAEPGSVA